MNTREPYEIKESTIKNSVKAVCLLLGKSVHTELFIDEIDELKSTIPQIVKYTLFTFHQTCELTNWLSNLIKDDANSDIRLQVFLKDLYSDVNDVKIGLKYAMDKLYDA